MEEFALALSLICMAFMGVILILFHLTESDENENRRNLGW